jgi:HTH-type transcriptional regulator/antitoxin HipB
MSDLETYIERRKHKDHEFEEGLEQGYREFKIGVVLKQAREQAGLTNCTPFQNVRSKTYPMFASG